MLTISELWVYPIKSCAGTRVSAAELTATGLANDRLLMIVDARGHFMTQRLLPRMALIRPTLIGDSLTLDAPDQPVLALTVQRTGAARPVVVWGDECLAVDQGDAVADWLSAFLGRPLRLVALHAQHRRAVDRGYALDAADEVGFADGFALLLIGQASLDLLNSKLDAPIEMRRFRPNIVVSGGAPHAEDAWRLLRVNGIDLNLVKPCARCAIPTVDPASGIKGLEPSRTLATYRARDGKIYFGQNVIHAGRGTLRVGDALTLVA